MAAHMPAEDPAHKLAAAHNHAAVLHTPVAAVELHIPGRVAEGNWAEGTLLVVLQMQKSSASVTFPCLVQKCIYEVTKSIPCCGQTFGGRYHQRAWLCLAGESALSARANASVWKVVLRVVSILS